MKLRSVLAFAILAVSGLLTVRFLRASIAGETNVSITYGAELRGDKGRYEFRIDLEPVMFRLQTMQGKYRLVRLRISNSTTTALALSADRDRIELLMKDAPAVAAVLNPLRLDPAFWGSLAAETRETLAYPLTLKGITASTPGGDPPSRPESLYIYLLVPAVQVDKAPVSFRYTIASLNQTIEVRTSGPSAPRNKNDHF
jgi:hypothetical protein